MRIALIAPATLIGLMVAGCGSGGGTPVTHTPSASPSASAIATPLASATPTPSAVSVTSVMLTAAEVVAATGGKGLVQVKDGEVQGQAGTDQRDFEDPAHTFYIEIQLYELDSADSAASEYPAVKQSGPSGFSKIDQTLMPTIRSANRADEWIGILGGVPGIAVTFQQGQFLCSEWAKSNAGFVTDTLGPGVASAESQKIAALTGG